MRGSARTFSTSTRILFLSLCGLIADAKTHRVDALVLAVNVAEGTFVAAHRPIAGYMPAMTMKFSAEPGAPLSTLVPGSRIEFEVSDGVARRIRTVATADPDLIRPAVPVGSLVPDFALTDQTGRQVRLSDLRGKVVVLQFIYTRCPLAEVCPRMAADFATLQRRLESKDLVLLSISLDPRFDTPEVLTAYAKRWQAKLESWRFLTGSEKAVNEVASNFGVVYWPEDGSLTHTARTALIDRTGKLAALVEGYSYRTDQLTELVRHQLEVVSR